MQPSPPKPPARLSRATVAIVWMAAAAGTIALLLIAAGTAEGGAYRAVQCSPGLGAGHADLNFQRNSAHYVGDGACQEGRGLSIRHGAARSSSGRWGAWTLEAPTGASLERVSARVVGVESGGHVPELLVGFPGSEPAPFGPAIGRGHIARWEGEGADGFQARLRCDRASGCGAGAPAKLRLRRLAVGLLDERAPMAELGGQLVADRTQRGTPQLTAIATDSGGGLRRVFLHVNGEPVGVRTLACKLTRGIPTRLRPCPASAEASFQLDTEGAPFRQGPNQVRACALDFATSSDGNRGCASKRIRVDNACPVDATADAGRLQARIAGARADGSIVHGESAQVVGRLVDGSGEGIEGAEICVATRTDLHGSPERVVATPETGVEGRFEAPLAPGPSREVRIAHWAGSDRVAESYLRLGVRARPRLRLRPRGTLRNGDRVRFAVRLHGPSAEGRRAHVKVRAGRRWLKLRTGSTGRSGRWHSAYRFQATTGVRTYRFRASVPGQRDYPFEGGRSDVREVRVEGLDG
jgi:hypothetical protein